MSEMQLRLIADIFQDEELRPVLEKPAPAFRVSGIQWYPEGADSIHRSALKTSVPVLLKQLRLSQAYLLVGYARGENEHKEKATQLWETAEGEEPYGIEICRSRVGFNDGVRVFGAMQLGLGLSDKALQLMERDFFSHLVILRPEEKLIVQELVATGWKAPDSAINDYYAPSSEIIRRVCSTSTGVVFATVGEFFEDASSLIAFGRAEVIGKLFSAIK